MRLAQWSGRARLRLVLGVLGLGLAGLISTPVAAQEPAERGTAAVLRGLDKVNGHTMDAEVQVGGSAAIFGVIVTLSECRYPKDNPTGDAYAYLTVRNPQNGEVYFEGWMIASSPALSALDHSRYDVWVMRCKSS
ncbi:hypothetical protein PH5382_00094 [Phaeobacter sp. CECT 5382]|nr:hypothetical protein PH5382_00094 [Phaeobacter sp. CECT 5382]